jgi:hypothetical protein
MDEELQNRIRRIYAAIRDISERDISKFQPHLSRSEKCVFVCQDFRGGLSDEQLSNLAYSAISNLANLKDHLRRWAKRHGRDPDRVDETVRESTELKVIIDLSNADKHGGGQRDGGWSGTSPELTDVKRVMSFSIGRDPHPSSVSLALTPEPVVLATGSGSAAVIVIGRIVDGNGLYIGDLYRFLAKGTAAWEHLLTEFGMEAESSE